ncbi:hypothetical protein KCU83_g356, partial [Aureobasidium melanogenum]
MALIAAWKASSRESCADLFSVFWFGDLFGSDGVDGSVFDSTVSSHGFVFAVVMCACRFDAVGGMHAEHRVRDVSTKGDQQIAFALKLNGLFLFVTLLIQKEVAEVQLELTLSSCGRLASQSQKSYSRTPYHHNFTRSYPVSFIPFPMPTTSEKSVRMSDHSLKRANVHSYLQFHKTNINSPLPIRLTINSLTMNVAVDNSIHNGPLYETIREIKQQLPRKYLCFFWISITSDHSAPSEKW